MAVKVGMGTQYGVAAESTVGTYVAPTRFRPVNSVSADLNYERYNGKGLQPGRYAQQSDLSILTTRSGTVSVTREVLSKGEGLSINTLHGATVTPTVVGATAAYTQAHPIGLTTPDGRALTQQYKAPGTGGTSNVITALGTLPTSFKYSIAKGGVLMVEESYWATDINDSETLATASYVASPTLFSFDNATLLLGGSVSDNLPSEFECTITLPRDDGRHYLGGTATAAEALQNDYVAASGSFQYELANMDEFDAAKAGTLKTLKLTCLSEATIAAATYAKFELDFACVVLGQATPQVTGPGIITVTQPFEAQISSTNPLLTINTTSLDTTL